MPALRDLIPTLAGKMPALRKTSRHGGRRYKHLSDQLDQHAAQAIKQALQQHAALQRNLAQSMRGLA